MAKITIQDICNDIANNKNYYFGNGFFYNSLHELMTRGELRESVAFRYTRYKVDEVDKMEEVISEFNKVKGKDPRGIYLSSLADEKGECYILEWLKVQYPQYDWEQIFYDIIMRKTEKNYIFWGVNGAGKSQIFDLLKIMFDNFYIAMTIEQMSNKFNLSGIIGKLLLVGDDLGKEDFGTVIGLVKSMTTGQGVMLERKFMHPIYCENKANFVFGTNNMPYLDITDEGILRRFIVLRFDKEMVLPCGYDEFREKYINEAQAKRLLCRLRKVKYNREVIEKLNNDTKLFLLSNSPVKKANTTTYDTYKVYCQDNGFKPYNKDNFEKALTLLNKYKESVPPELIPLTE